ncbi:MAG: Ig-like domain-containing protein [Spirochaetes bacterium]|nr:Ig-like domain-containing protein [Spirochaetota bacterium]
MNTLPEIYRFRPHGKPGKKYRTTISIRYFMLFTFICCIAAFSPGCGDEFKVIMDEGMEKTALVPVTGVSLNKTNSTILVGGTLQLNPAISPSSAANQNVTWSSNADRIAAVSSSGMVSGISAGSASITVTTEDGNYTAACSVTVSDTAVAVTGVNLNKTNSTIVAGGTLQLNPAISPSNATNQNVTWSSSDTDFATVTSSGLVSGVAPGSAIITVTTNDGGYTAACAITVTSASVPVTGVTLDKITSTIEEDGTVQLNPVISPFNATNQNVTWSSSNTSIATVSSGGQVYGRAPGSATITVTTNDGGYTAACAITVTAAPVPVTGVTLDKATSTIEAGGSVQLNPAISPSNATNQNVTWSSSNTDIATVSSSGLVSGVALGTAVITVTTEDGGHSDTCEIEVSSASVPVTHVDLNIENSTIYTGETVQLIPSITPSTAVNQNVTWSSNAPGVADVSSNGLVLGKALGNAIITVTTDDGGYTDTCNITVANIIFWTESDGTINRIYTDQTGETSILTVSGTPLDIALDTSGREIYWTEHSGSSYQIRKADIDGSNEDNFSIAYSGSTYFGPTAIAIDSAANNIYWNRSHKTSGNEYIYFSALNSFSVNQWSANVPFSYVYSICIDAAYGRLYFNTNTYWDIGSTLGSGWSGAACYSSDIDSVNSYSTEINETSSSQSSVRLRGVASDGNYVYYVYNNSTGLRIVRARYDFQEKTDPWITASGFGIQKIALDPDAGKIYWTSETNNRIYRADLGTANSGIEVFHTTGSTPTGIAITQ